MKKRYKAKLVKTAIAVAMTLGVYLYNNYADSLINSIFAEDTSSQFEKVTVQSVADGDTITVRNNGENIKIRMIGVNTPESVSSDESENTPEGKLASDFTKENLKPGTTVYLEYDKDRTDQYGRTLAYVWLSDDVDTTDFEDFKKYNYGAILLQETYCEAVYYAPNGKYRSWYESLD